MRDSTLFSPLCYNSLTTSSSVAPVTDSDFSSAQKLQVQQNKCQLSIADGLYSPPFSFRVYATRQAPFVTRSHLPNGGRQFAVQQRQRLVKDQKDQDLKLLKRLMCLTHAKTLWFQSAHTAGNACKIHTLKTRKLTSSKKGLSNVFIVIYSFIT